MHKSLKTLFISALLGTGIFAQHSIASQSTAPSTTGGNINAMNIDTCNIIKSGNTTGQANKALRVVEHQGNTNLAAQGGKACEQFRSINALVSKALIYLSYIDIHNFVSTRKAHIIPARSVLMKVGDKWLTWVKGLPPDTLIDEVAAALTRTPNPIGELRNIVNLYYLQVPLKDRFLNKDPHINKGHAIQLQDKAELRTELRQVSDETRRQELLALLKPCAAQWRPYAIAHTMLHLLKKRPAFIFDIPPTPQLEENWLAIKIDPLIVQEYLRYARATYRIMPIIHNCLDSQGDAALKDKEMVSAALWQAHELYIEVGNQFDGIGTQLPPTAATFAAEDQLIALYQRYLYDLRALNQQQARTARPVFLRRTGEKSRTLLTLHATEQAYENFLDARHQLIDDTLRLHDAPNGTSEEMLSARKKVLALEMDKLAAERQNNNNNTQPSALTSFDFYSSP